MSRTRIQYKAPKEKHIKEQNLPCGLDVVFPSDASIQSSVEALVEQYGKEMKSFTAKGPLSMFFRAREDGSSFSAAVFQRSDAWIISKNQIDADNVFAVWGGEVHMSLTRSTYQTTGLNGKKSRYGEKYLISFNLRDPNFHTGTKQHNRFLFGLEQLDRLHPDLEYSVTVHADDAKYVSEYLSNVKEVPLKTTVSERNVLVPALTPPEVPELKDAHSREQVNVSQKYRDYLFENWALGVQEWVGLASIGAGRIASDDNVDSLFNQYEVEDGTPANVTNIQIVGMCPLLATKLKEIGEQSNTPFFAFTAYGVQDTPYSWGNKEHQFDNGGENDYTIVNIGEDVLSFETVGHSDMYI
ncbi:hypothetical protein CJU89_1494 [Yarrowia sp. B02]|nr:hypothetical protein CJU89_1494 [Yarrowia sp. B02]